VLETLIGKQAKFIGKDSERNKEQLQSGLGCQVRASAISCTREVELTWNPAAVMDISPATSSGLRLVLQFQRCEEEHFPCRQGQVMKAAVAIREALINRSTGSLGQTAVFWSVYTFSSTRSSSSKTMCPGCYCNINIINGLLSYPKPQDKG